MPQSLAKLHVHLVFSFIGRPDMVRFQCANRRWAMCAFISKTSGSIIG